MFRLPFDEGSRKGVGRESERSDAGVGLSAPRLQRAEANDFLRNGNTRAAGAKWRRLGPARMERGGGIIGPKQDTY